MVKKDLRGKEKIRWIRINESPQVMTRYRDDGSVSVDS